MDEGLLLRMLKGIVTRNYETCGEVVPEAFGLSSSTVSRRYAGLKTGTLLDFETVDGILIDHKMAEEDVSARS